MSPNEPSSTDRLQVDECDGVAKVRIPYVVTGGRHPSERLARPEFQSYPNDTIASLRMYIFLRQQIDLLLAESPKLRHLLTILRDGHTEDGKDFRHYSEYPI